MAIETVLAGQNPSEPAIDQLTGQPLTMEELLRRRGILSPHGVPDLFNRTQNSVPATATPPSAVAGALAANGGPTPSAVSGTAVGGTNPTQLGGALAPGGGAPAVPGANEQTPVDPRTLNDSDLMHLLAVVGTGLGAGVIIGGGAALLAEVARRRAASTPLEGVAETVAATPLETEVNTTRTPNDADIIDGEYRVVPSPKTLAQEATGSMGSGAGPTKLGGAVAQRQLPAPTRRLTDTVRGKGIPDYSPPPGYKPPNSRKELGARQSVQSRSQPRGDNPIHLPSRNKYEGLTPEQITYIQTYGPQLYESRLEGAVAARQGKGPKRGVRNSGPASAPVRDYPAFENELVNAIRKLNPSALRRLAR